MGISLIGVEGMPLVGSGDDIAYLIISALNEGGEDLLDGDIIVIAETIVSKAEGNIISLEEIEPSPEALDIAERTGKDPSLVEAILGESSEIIRVGHDFIVSETRHGFVCANAGIDESNVDDGLATPLPRDPDGSAERILRTLQEATGRELAVIISDTQGRPFREGAVGVAVGVAGLSPIWDRKGERDLYGRSLETTRVAVADELAAAASLVMGQADEGVPAVIIRGYPWGHLRSDGGVKPLLRARELDVFRG
ncbi:coenzyme F420-0:L-glutamate ligase [Methanothermobacter thermautotrophicus]|jgi:coenzyme F420-0:L-glutamate ligase/coenzyme F420-1:gamma-L-glutamate ligase|uniref:coenzyme F420-0:L-glutamate ligase n=1 Tax=Methanothermobacter thermautotrophicus TaxID=145262 RepID=UPI00264FFA1A|nr:coenzyme F420-0:L-glutamate ligase [Methanothermobacter thermautotrophicus]MDK2875212.1 coenzyme F420-0:L-glutamate ligase / coenzyme F420:gamma-L-glutamate ligase [Methanothermobacter sp.]MDN5374425.1 coenzyme F420-0:L-glutamate ligase / coenzyme F420:gamma-L-glutamate ligase [Methanothermobacter sp.]HOQ18669.1 coenzyme F420-0:L-glutamate ligase [Methanothermobacter thermautotrophicus]